MTPSADRYLVRMREARESLRIIGQAMDTSPAARSTTSDARSALPPRNEIDT